MTRRILTALGLAAILVLWAPAWADEPPPEAPPETPAEPLPDDPAGGSDVMELSLQRALEMGAQANLGLLESSYNAPIAHQGRVAAEASFDYLLTAGVTAAHNESPSTNMFLGAGVVVNNTINSQVGVTRRLRSGGSISLLYRADRVSTNNPFATVDPAYSQGLSIEASRPLLRGAGDVAMADIRRAQNGIVAAKAGHRTQVEATLLAVAEAYWGLVFADENLLAQRKAEEVARELLDDAGARLKAEVGTPLDVAEARAGVERRRSEVLQALNFRETVQDGLLRLILPFAPGLTRSVRIVPTDAVSLPPESLPSRADEQHYVDLAMQGRPELQGSKAEIATNGIDVLVARDAIRPQLDVIGRVASDGLDSIFGDSIQDVLGGRAVSGAIGIEFSLFLGQRAARAEWTAAAWRRRQALLRQMELQNRIIVEVRAALRDLDTARGQLGAAEAEVAAADEALRGERLKQGQGKSTPFRVLQKDEDLTAARTRRGRAAADLRIAEARLQRAVGNLAGAHGIEVTRWQACCNDR